MTGASSNERLGLGLLGGLSLAGLGGCLLLLAWLIARGLGAGSAEALAALGGSLGLLAGVVALAVLPGALVAAWLSEGRGAAPLRRAVRLGCRAFAGLPPVLMGVAAVVFAVRWGGLSGGYAPGVLALSLGALPRVVCAVDARLREVPEDVREAALSLGAGPWQTLWSAVLPAAGPGIGASLGRVLARTAGETAPLIIAWGGLTLTAAAPDSGSALPYHLFSLALRHTGGPAGAIDGIAFWLLGLTVLLGVGPAALLERREERRLW